MLTPNLVSDRPPLYSIFFILLSVFVGVVAGSWLGRDIISSFYDGDLLNDVQNIEQHPEAIRPLIGLQAFATLIGFIIVPLIYLTAFERKPLAAFFPSQKKIFLILVLTLALGLTFMISISPLVEWNMHVEFPEFLKGFERWARETEDRTAELTKAMTTFGSRTDLLIGIIVIALLPAIGEELVFRGLFQNEFFRATGNAHLAIWFSAIIFSAIHFQFYGFVPRLLLGALFGYLYYWSGNLLVPMFAHFFNNAFGVIMIYLHQHKITDLNVEDTTAAPLQYVFLNAALTVGLLYYIWKHYRELPERPTNAL